MLEWVTVPGCDPPVKLQIQTGQPLQILRAFVADYNAYVEPVRDADCACWTPTNSVPTSNHLNGTAVDIRWESHPFRVRGTFGDRLPALRELLAFYKGVIFWGGDWTDPIDEMHFNLDYGSYGNPATAEFIRTKIRPDGFSTYKRGATTMTAPTAVLAASVAGTEKVLRYNHAQQNVAQEKFFDCCPASTQIVLDGLGVAQSEDDLIRAIGTTTDGTNTVEQALPVLNRLTAGAYVAVWLPNDPPTGEQTEQLWRNLTSSIDAGYGAVLNFEVPANNFPRGTRGSVSPAYRGGKVWHYVACMGYANDGPGGRHLWIADPGFAPFGYWMSLEQAATAIPPHAYAYATARPVGVLASATVPAAPAATTAPPMAPPADLPGQYRSRSGYRTPGEAAIGGVEQFALNDDAMIHTLFVEVSAVVLTDPESIYRVVRAAAGRGADPSPGFVRRARTVLGKVPREQLAAALAVIERDEPDLLAALVGGRK
jgi:hypothetical protein